MSALHAFILAGCVLVTSSCRKDGLIADPCGEVTYEKTIKPISAHSCAITGCHVAGFLPGDFTTYSGLKEKADNGKLQQVLFTLKTMPPGKKLSSTETRYIKCWIDNGAKDN